MMRRTVTQKVIASAVLAAAMVLLVVGCFRSYKVYDPDTEEFGLVAFTRVRDAQLVVDATFSGTVRKGDRLYSTYDRSEPRGKRSCPT